MKTTVSTSTSRVLRDKAARILRAGRKAIRGANLASASIYAEVADTYKRLAHTQEKLRGEPQRSAPRPKPRPTV